jgi:hypothetical protein
VAHERSPLETLSPLGGTRNQNMHKFVSPSCYPCKIFGLESTETSALERSPTWDQQSSKKKMGTLSSTVLGGLAIRN